MVFKKIIAIYSENMGLVIQSVVIKMDPFTKF
jgi:hypothetical protein